MSETLRRANVSDIGFSPPVSCLRGARLVPSEIVATVDCGGILRSALPPIPGAVLLGSWDVSILRRLTGLSIWPEFSAKLDGSSDSAILEEDGKEGAGLGQDVNFLFMPNAPA